jgi:hypothetical protein
MYKKYFSIILVIFSIFLIFSCDKKSQFIPEEYKPFISSISTPVEYKEIIPSHGGTPLPMPEILTRQQAMEDIRMFEYLWSTSYSGYEYWKFKGVNFESYFNDLRTYAGQKDSIRSIEFEQQLAGILKQIFDGHIYFTGHGYYQAYRHKSIYFCDILVDKSTSGKYKVIASQCEQVNAGDEFTQQDAENYLFKTLSPAGKQHYLVGIHSFDPISFHDLSFNGKIIRISFHGSRLKFARFRDPEPFYIRRRNNIPVVRVTGFGDQLYPQMKQFMNSANELKNEPVIIINLFYNGGGSSVFPQGFIRNLNGVVQWETSWANLYSPAITEYFYKYDLSSMPDISPIYRNLITHHKNMYPSYKKTPAKKWEFDATHDQKTHGSYKGKLIILANRRVLSAGEGMVGVSRSVKNSIVIGENTGGSAQFSSTCGYYLPHSKFVVNLPRQFILIPGLEECIGYLPDYWLDTHEPVEEVFKWLEEPENYQFSFSGSYSDLIRQISVSPVLPADLKIITPEPGIPKELAQYSGKWSGIWDGVLDNMLVVEKINENLEVEAIYAWGVAYQWNLNQPGWTRYSGRFENNTLILFDENTQTVITYRIQMDGSMQATFRRPGIFSRSILEKTIP